MVIDEGTLTSPRRRYKPFVILRGRLPGAIRDEEIEKGSLKGAACCDLQRTAPEATGDFRGRRFRTGGDVVRDWVRAGGSLLLIADHAPRGGPPRISRNGSAWRWAKALYSTWRTRRNPTFLSLAGEWSLRQPPAAAWPQPFEQVSASWHSQPVAGVPDGAVALLKLALAPRSASRKAGRRIRHGFKDGPTRERTITAHAGPWVVVPRGSRWSSARAGWWSLGGGDVFSAGHPL